MIPAPPRISPPPRPESRLRGPPPATRPKANDADTPTLPPRHKRFPPTAPPVPARPHPTRRQFPARGASGSRPLARPARHHAYLSTLTPQPDGYLCLEQSNECGSLPHRFGRAPHSLKVSSRGGVAAGVSGGREDDAAGDTAQRSGLVLGGAPRSASCWARRRMGWSATLKTSRHAAPSRGT